MRFFVILAIAFIICGCNGNRTIPTIDSEACLTVSRTDISSDILKATGKPIENSHQMSFVVPAQKDMTDIIVYLEYLWFDMDIKFINFVNDCQDYAELKTKFATLVVKQSTKQPVSPGIFVMYVYQEHEWGGVGIAPMHAVVLYAINDNGTVALRVWEPQNSKTCSISTYPNTAWKVFVP